MIRGRTQSAGPIPGDQGLEQPCGWWEDEDSKLRRAGWCHGKGGDGWRETTGTGPDGATGNRQGKARFRLEYFSKGLSFDDARAWL